MANTYTDLLKLRKPALGDTAWDDEVNDNTQINEVAMAAVLRKNRVTSGLAPSDGGGLDVDVASGAVTIAGTDHAVSSDTLTATASVKNWVYVNSSGTLVISTTAPTGDYAAIAIVDAGASAIDRIGDLRNHAEVAVSTFMKTVLDDADAAAVFTTLGISSFVQTILDDADAAAVLATLGLLTSAHAFSANQNLSQSTLTISASAVALDFIDDGNAYLSLDEDATLSAPSNLASGRSMEIRVVQDATGGWTLSFDSSIDFAGYDAAVNAAANATTIYQLWTDGTKVYARKIWEDD